MKTYLRGVVLVATGAAVMGFAAEADDANPRFSVLDANGDGKLTQTEFLTSVRGKADWWSRGENAAKTEQNSPTPTVFLALDRNRDGYVTQAEWDQGQSFLKSRGDNGEGASRSRNVTPPGDPHRSQKAHSATEKKGTSDGGKR